MQARQLPARSGLDWLRAAYALYRRNPPLLTSVTMLYLLVVIGLNFLPIIGAFIVPMLLPTLNLIVGNTCRVIEGGQTPDKPALLLGVREHKPQLLRLGGLQLAGSVLLLLLSMLLEGGVLPLPDLVEKNKELADLLKVVHRILNYGFMLVVAGHAAAALKHHWVARDDVLRRMVPFGSRD